MRITIRQPLAFSEIGRKDNQEDALYPNPATVGVEQRVFLMCDGMGGHEHGEIASNTVAEVMGKVLSESADPRNDLQMALSLAYDALDAKDSGNSSRKMGTTMTCLILDEQGAVIAHIGDSRVYHVRPTSGLMFQTEDHSLVNDLVRAGELTMEEAKDYPHKNIITRAIQPHLERRFKADVKVVTDIQPGDYFFLCCDGVLEQLTNQRLCEVLAMPIPDKDKLALIKAGSDGKTKDNYTCWLVPVDEVEGASDIASDSDDDVILAVDDDQSEAQIQSGPSVTQHQDVVSNSGVKNPPQETPKIPGPQDDDTPMNPSGILNKLNFKYIVGLLVFIVLICAIVGGFRECSEPEKQVTGTDEQQVTDQNLGSEQIVKDPEKVKAEPEVLETVNESSLLKTEEESNATTKQKVTEENPKEVDLPAEQPQNTASEELSH